MTTLTMQNEKRIEIVERVFRGALTVLRAAVTLGAERATVLIKPRVHQEELKMDPQKRPARAKTLNRRFFDQLRRFHIIAYRNCPDLLSRRQCVSHRDPLRPIKFTKKIFPTFVSAVGH